MVVCLIVTFKTNISRVLNYGKLSSQEELEVNDCIKKKKKSTYYWPGKSEMLNKTLEAEELETINSNRFSFLIV